MSPPPGNVVAVSYRTWVLNALRFLTNCIAIITGTLTVLFILNAVTSWVPQDTIGKIAILGSICCVCTVIYFYLTTIVLRQSDPTDAVQKPSLKNRLIKITSNIGAVICGSVSLLEVLLIIDTLPHLYNNSGLRMTYVSYLVRYTILFVLSLIFTVAFTYLYFRKPRVVKEADHHISPEILTLKQQLLNPGWESLNAAAEKLGEIARKSPEKIKPLVPVLISDFHSREKYVGSGAALAILKIGEANPEVLALHVADLIHFLEYTDTAPDYEIIAKRAAVYVLGLIDTDEKMRDLIKGTLERHLNDSDEYVRKNAKEGYEKLTKISR